MSKAEQGKLFINWIKAYLECLSEGRGVDLITIQVRERQLRLFK